MCQGRQLFKAFLLLSLRGEILSNLYSVQLDGSHSFKLNKKLQIINLEYRK